MDYWGQQVAIVCELCGGWHDTYQCANFQSQQQPFSDTYQPEINNHPIFSWDNQYGMQQSYLPSSPYQDQQYGVGPYDPSGMQQSYQPSYPLQNQQFGAWPYDPSEIQQQQGQQFQHHYAPWEQQCQYPEFQEPQYAPWQQQFQPPEFQEQQFHTSYDQDSNEKIEMEELRLMFKDQAESLKALQNQIDQITNALLNEPQGALPSEAETNPTQRNGKEQEEVITRDWEAEPLALADLDDSQVHLKPSSEEAPELELEPLPEHLRYAYLGESSILPVIIDANMSGSEEDKSLRIHCMHTILLEDGSKLSVESQGRLYSIMKEVEKEEIIKWPMFGVHKNLAMAKVDEFRHQAYENSKLLKEQIRKWLDRQLAYKTLHPP